MNTFLMAATVAITVYNDDQIKQVEQVRGLMNVRDNCFNDIFSLGISCDQKHVQTSLNHINYH